MEPITAAIVAALTLAGTGAVQAVGAKAVDAAYDKLKRLLRKKDHNEVVGAIERLEASPDGRGLPEAVQAQVLQSRADEDPEIREVVQELVAALEVTSAGPTYVQKVKGNHNAVVQGGGSATVHVHRTEEEK